MGYDAYLGGKRGEEKKKKYRGIGIVSHTMGSRAKVSVSWECSSEPRKDNANGEFATIIMLLLELKRRGVDGKQKHKEHSLDQTLVVTSGATPARMRGGLIGIGVSEKGHHVAEGGSRGSCSEPLLVY